MTTLQKIVFIVTCIGAALVVINQVKPGLFPVNITYPAIAVITVAEAIAYWNQKRKWSYLLLAGTAVSMAFFLLELFLL